MSHARLKNLSNFHMQLEPSSALAHLRNCPELRELELSIGSPSWGKCYEHLKGLRNLKKLALFTIEELSDVGCGHLSDGSRRLRNRFVSTAWVFSR